MFDICSYLKENHNIELIEQQECAVNTVDGSILLLAVPGAGKTTVMVSRIANMIFKDNVDPKSILTITFSKAGAVDMKARYEKLFGKIHEENSLIIPNFSTIHSFCYRIIQDYSRNKHGKIFELISPLQCFTILKDIYNKINHEFLTEDLQEELISCFSFIQNRLLKKTDMSLIETGINNLWELFEEYQAAKRELDLMDFDDMLSYSYIILRKYPNLRERYNNQYKYLCVDEAQDTSLLQHKILEILALPTNNLFLVGDEDQSIYRFRGASPETLLDFSKKYPNAQILKMEENFRSGKQIVEQSNIFISQNKLRYQKNMYSNLEKTGEIHIVKLPDLSDEYRFILSTVRKEKGSVAVIYRNNFSAIPLVDILDKNNIDFYIKDQKGKVIGNYVVRDVQAFFALSFDSSNYSAFKIIFNKNCAYLRKGLLNDIDKSPLRLNETWFDRLLEIKDDKINTGKIRYIASLIDKLGKMNPVKALDTIYNSIGYMDFVKYVSGGSFSNQSNKMSALKSIASRGSTVKAFLKRIEEMDDIILEHSGHNGNRLTLTTAHSAKGLEFDTVILIDVLDDIFPTSSAIEDLHTGKMEAMEEEARLFYVACTRARNHLYIPTSNLLSGVAVKESRFVERLITNSQKKQDKFSKIFTGTKLNHSYFGDGQVVSIDRKKGTFQVFFGKNDTRNLSIEILNKQGIITILT